MQRPAEVIVATLLIAVALVAFAASYQMSGGINAASTDTPMRLPRILLVIWAGLAVVCVVRAGWLAGSDAMATMKLKRLGAFLLILSLTAIALLFWGYLIPVTLGLVCMLWLLGERHPGRFIGAVLILGPGLWYLFHHLLGLRLPVLLSGGAF